MTAPDERPTREQITAAEAHNDNRLNVLAQSYGIQFDQASIMRVRLDAIVDAVFGADDNPIRLAFDWDLTRRYAAEIDTAEAHVRRQALTNPTGAPQGLIIPPTNGARRGRPIRDNPQA